MKECPGCGLEFRGSWEFDYCPECGGKLEED